MKLVSKVMLVGEEQEKVGNPDTGCVVTHNCLSVLKKCQFV